MSNLIEACLCAAALAGVAAAQVQPGTGTVPILSAAVAFIPTVQGGHPTLLGSTFAPVVLVPFGEKWLVESRATFEGDFARRNGTGPFGGAVEKQVDYLELDYIADRYVTVTAGRFLTPFGIYNERLYPVWIRNLQTEPLIFPIEESSSNGVMLRGGIPLRTDLIVNYAAYFSTLTTNAFLSAGRQTGGRVGVFLPRERVEVGFSLLHKMQENHANSYGVHLEWQPRRVPLDIRSELADSVSGHGYWIEPAFRLSSFRRANAVTSRTQLVARMQQFFPGRVADDEGELPTVRTQQAEFGFNYYLADAWRVTASTGRQFSAAGNHNVWTVGMTYRFALPLGRGGWQ